MGALKTGIRVCIAQVGLRVRVSSLIVLRVGVVVSEDTQVPMQEAGKGWRTGCVVSHIPFDVNSLHQVGNPGHLEDC